MRPILAYGALLALLAAAALLLHPATPWQAAVVLLAAAVVGARHGRRSLMAGAAVGVVVYGILLAVAVPGAPALAVGPLRLGADGAWRGVRAALRLGALVAVNVAVLTWLKPAPLLEALRLPRRATALLAAVLLAMEDVVRDFGRLRDQQRLGGAWPRGQVARARSAALLLAPLMVLAHERGRVRAEALGSAGLRTGPRFAPLVAVTAVAAAGRLAFIALPNVALTYVAVFLGGMLYGVRVGAASGFLAMALTNLVLSGLHPAAWVNAPAMALVGVMGAAFGRLPSGDGRAAVAAWAAAAGMLGTFLFSVASDAATWLVAPETRGDPAVLRAYLLAGLAFNALPALVNGVLFSAAVGPVARAFAARGITRAQAPPAMPGAPLDPAPRAP